MKVAYLVYSEREWEGKYGHQILFDKEAAIAQAKNDTVDTDREVIVTVEEWFEDGVCNLIFEQNGQGLDLTKPQADVGYPHKKRDE